MSQSDGDFTNIEKDLVGFIIKINCCEVFGDVYLKEPFQPVFDNYRARCPNENITALIKIAEEQLDQFSRKTYSYGKHDEKKRTIKLNLKDKVGNVKQYGRTLQNMIESTFSFKDNINKQTEKKLSLRQLLHDQKIMYKKNPTTHKTFESYLNTQNGNSSSMSEQYLEVLDHISEILLTQGQSIALKMIKSEVRRILQCNIDECGVKSKEILNKLTKRLELRTEEKSSCDDTISRKTNGTKAVWYSERNDDIDDTNDEFFSEFSYSSTDFEKEVKHSVQCDSKLLKKDSSDKVSNNNNVTSNAGEAVKNTINNGNLIDLSECQGNETTDLIEEKESCSFNETDESLEICINNNMPNVDDHNIQCSDSAGEMKIVEHNKDHIEQEGIGILPTSAPNSLETRRLEIATSKVTELETYTENDPNLSTLNVDKRDTITESFEISKANTCANSTSNKTPTNVNSDISNKNERTSIKILELHEHFSSTNKNLSDFECHKDFVQYIREKATAIEEKVDSYQGTDYSVEFYIIHENLVRLLEDLDRINCKDNDVLLGLVIDVSDYIKGLIRRLQSNASSD